jgi:hypothetical protein
MNQPAANAVAARLNQGLAAGSGLAQVLGRHFNVTFAFADRRTHFFY